jgi:hypothetical protein
MKDSRMLGILLEALLTALPLDGVLEDAEVKD